MSRTDAQRKYDSKNIVTFTFTVNRSTEAELLDHLKSMDKRAAYIKRLVREDMERDA